VGLASLKLTTDTVTAGSLIYVPGQQYLVLLFIIKASHIQVFLTPKRVDTIYFDYKYTPKRAVDTGLMTFNL
jgi:hypothetical protein